MKELTEKEMSDVSGGAAFGLAQFAGAQLGAGIGQVIDWSKGTNTAFGAGALLGAGIGATVDASLYSFLPRSA